MVAKTETPGRRKIESWRPAWAIYFKRKEKETKRGKGEREGNGGQGKETQHRLQLLFSLFYKVQS